MNFHHMPELDWYYGYPMSFVLMLISAVGPYLYFKRARLDLELRAGSRACLPQWLQLRRPPCTAPCERGISQRQVARRLRAFSPNSLEMRGGPRLGGAAAEIVGIVSHNPSS